MDGVALKILNDSRYGRLRLLAAEIVDLVYREQCQNLVNEHEKNVKLTGDTQNKLDKFRKMLIQEGFDEIGEIADPVVLYTEIVRPLCLGQIKRAI